MVHEPSELLQLLVRPPPARARSSVVDSSGPDPPLGGPPPEPAHLSPMQRKGPRTGDGAADPYHNHRPYHYGDSYGGDPGLQGSQYGSSSQALPAGEDAPASRGLYPVQSPGKPYPLDRCPTDAPFPSTQASQAEDALPSAADAPRENPIRTLQPPPAQGIVVAASFGAGDVVAMQFEAARGAVALAAQAPARKGLLAGRRQGFGSIAVHPAGTLPCPCAPPHPPYYSRTFNAHLNLHVSISECVIHDATQTIIFPQFSRLPSGLFTQRVTAQTERSRVRTLRGAHIWRAQRARAACRGEWRGHCGCTTSRRAGLGRARRPGRMPPTYRCLRWSHQRHCVPIISCVCVCVYASLEVYIWATA